MNTAKPEDLRYKLLGEPGRWYIVYPSWAEFSYRWEDLPALFADPLATSYTDPISARYSKETKRQYWSDLGWPTENIEPAHLTGGPSGGGIISTKDPYRGRWLPAAILNKEANNCVPNGMSVAMKSLPFLVSYLEPFDSPLLALAPGRKRTKLYLCTPTPEHIEADREHVYWVVGIKQGRRKPEAIGRVPEWSKAFGLDVSELTAVPETLREETHSWFTTPDVEFFWFLVAGGGSGAGYHYAMVLYLAMHLRFVVGPRMKYMHLLASMEGKPRIRTTWPDH